jgi:rhombotail lipoprotein
MPADSEVDNFNDAAILYWTIIGLWVIPGDTLERQTIVQAVLMDCRTGTILGTATGDHHAKRFASATLREPRWASMRKETTAAALQDLQKSCAALIDNLVAGSSAPAAALMPAN